MTAVKRPAAPVKAAPVKAAPVKAANVKSAPTLSDDSFKKELAALIPQLRAFARSLAGNPDLADDLVQDTMLKAWKNRHQYTPGPSTMRSWTFVILRNNFLSLKRRDKFVGEYDELAAERKLTINAAQNDQIHLSDLQRALFQLPLDQREALILIGAGGLSYEEAAEICGCAMGTIKSRVSRGRSRLQEILENEVITQDRQDAVAPSDAFGSIMSEVEQLTK
ncbi:sigma-70 family RNA polymerase sigma factor [Sphingorhabdus arenilitoris]|uniref:Sigma-70 family RNA polymerase sigma factor n=1 Tax=Sphingorhabdus arenilitoris TaxID=1490041 RepID=A0ABV8RC33_9SPHN